MCLSVYLLVVSVAGTLCKSTLSIYVGGGECREFATVCVHTFFLAMKLSCSTGYKRP